MLGRPERECYRVVPLASGICVLVVRHRREHTNHKSKVPRPVRSCRGKLLLPSPWRTFFQASMLQIDPNRTISAGKVDIGAFRCFPEGYQPPSASTSSYQSIPLEKIEDFGVHADQYYSLNVEVFTSKRDEELLGRLWNKYWVNTLSTSPLISVRSFQLFTSLVIDIY